MLAISLDSESDSFHDVEAVVQHYVYDSFGRATVLDATGTQYALDLAPIQQPYGYTGRELDSESDLYYYRARYYNPSTGRFLSEEPELDEGDYLNLYRYTANNPLLLMDSFGRDSNLKKAWEEVKKCKKAIDEHLKQGTCKTLKKIDSNEKCNEWDDNLKRIIDPRRWLKDNDKKENDDLAEQRLYTPIEIDYRSSPQISVNPPRVAPPKSRL